MYWKNGTLIPEDLLPNDPENTPMMYEVFRVYKHRALFLKEHLTRFFHSITLLGYHPPYSLIQITNGLNDLLDQEPDRIGNIKMRLYGFPNPILEMGFIPHHYPTRLEQMEGVTVVTLPFIRETPNAKKWNASLRNRTNQMMQETGAHEVLLTNAEGNITEGSRSNFFYVQQSILFTAPLASVLPGITRQKVLAIAESLHIPWQEHYLPEKQIYTVDELFISGTSPGIQPVARVNGIRTPSEWLITKRLQEAYNKQVTKELGAIYDE